MDLTKGLADGEYLDGTRVSRRSSVQGNDVVDRLNVAEPVEAHLEQGVDEDL